MAGAESLSPDTKVDNLNVHCSESLVKLVAKTCGVGTALGRKGERGVLKKEAS